ncbi:hypothetical protein I6F26_10410 [Ensifer sp. IC3342]|nr:hypothetical protein [Ensifer sp. BRP08]MCA1446991.1 hypothetical protein [Ensifer sp. IC3342]
MRLRLKDVPEEFRDDLVLFIVEGVLPLKNCLLMQVLTGLDALTARSFINRREHLSSIIEALQAECPDYAWSSVGACVRWERRGGLSGYRREFQ